MIIPNPMVSFCVTKTDGALCKCLIPRLLVVPFSYLRYGGRTLPPKTLMRAGKDATLLIYDGSKGDDEQEKGPTMVVEAIDIGAKYL